MELSTREGRRVSCSSWSMIEDKTREGRRVSCSSWSMIEDKTREGRRVSCSSWSMIEDNRTTNRSSTSRWLRHFSSLTLLTCNDSHHGDWGTSLHSLYSHAMIHITVIEALLFTHFTHMQWFTSRWLRHFSSLTLLTCNDSHHGDWGTSLHSLYSHAMIHITVIEALLFTHFTHMQWFTSRWSRHFSSLTLLTCNDSHHGDWGTSLHSLTHMQWFTHVALGRKAYLSEGLLSHFCSLTYPHAMIDTRGSRKEGLPLRGSFICETFLRGNQYIILHHHHQVSSSLLRPILSQFIGLRVSFPSIVW